MRFLLIFLLTILCLPALSAQSESGKNDSSLCITASHLSRVGEDLIVSMQIEITRPVASNQSIELIPRLQDSLGNFIQLPTIFVNGRKQHIVFLRERAKQEAGHEALRRRNGTVQTVRYLRALPFSEWMNHSTLSLIEQECGCSVPGNKDSVYVASLNTVSEIRPLLAFLIPQIEEVKRREENGSAFLDFPLNSILIQDDYRNNAVELQKITNSLDVIKNDTNVFISRICIHGYASPEGPYKNNEQLARGRTQALKDYICRKYTFSDTLLTTEYTPEDWEGLVKLLKDTVFKQQKELLSIAESTMAPDLKEQKMRTRYPDFFNLMLNNWLPALRHSDYTIYYVVSPFTLSQAKEVFKTQPKNLSIEEMFRIAQTYSVGSPEYNEIFMTAVRLNPGHPVANLNAANIALMQGNILDGSKYLDRALDCPEKTLARGVLHLLKREYEEAAVKFRQAEATGLPQGTENLKILSGFLID